MWQVEPTTQRERDTKWYQKKHPNELAAILRNLGRYLSHLNCTVNAKAVQAGFLHPEPMGIIAIDQKGGGNSLQETRAYTFADEAHKVLYVITIGNKQEQPSDIELSKDFVRDHVQTTT
jgi:hypothetical protein